MNRHAIHQIDRAMFVDIKPDRAVEFQIGDRASGQFQKITASREDAAELAQWLLEETAEVSP